MKLTELFGKLQKDAAEKGIPIFAGMELTSRCNLSCKMCYVKPWGENLSPHSSELTAKEWIRLGKEAVDAGVLFFLLTGGEPFLHADFKEIYEAYNKMGVRITVFTNGILATGEMAKWLAQRPPSVIEITLYGASERTYENLCGSGAAYHQAIKGIETLLKEGLNITIRTTITKTNQDDYKAIKKIAESYSVPFAVSNLIFGNRRAGINNIEKERLSPFEIIEFEEKKLAEEGLEQYNISLVELEDRIRRTKVLPSMACSAGRTTFYIDSSGRMLFCPLFTSHYCLPLEEGVEKSWERLKIARDSIPLPDKCSQCDDRVFCQMCPPKLQLESGDFTGNSDYLCSLAKAQRIRLTLLKNEESRR